MELGDASNLEVNQDFELAEEHYRLALQLSAPEQIDEAVSHIEATGIGPLPDGAKPTFIEHLRFATEFTKAQAEGLRRGVPSFVIAALGKSASASLTQTISQVLNIPIGNLSWSNFGREGRIVPMFARLIARGGAVTHEHYSATPDNLATLERAGVRRLYAHVRDPRQALISYIHHERWKQAGKRPEYFDRDHYDQKLTDEEITSAINGIYQVMVRWIGDWVAAADDGSCPIDVKVDSFERMTRERDGFYADLFKHFGVETTAEEVSGLIGSAEVRANYRRGVSGEWHDVLAAHDRARVSNMLPADLKDRFDWLD